MPVRAEPPVRSLRVDWRDAARGVRARARLGPVPLAEEPGHGAGRRGGRTARAFPVAHGGAERAAVSRAPRMRSRSRWPTCCCTSCAWRTRRGIDLARRGGAQDRLERRRSTRSDNSRAARASTTIRHRRKGARPSGRTKVSASGQAATDATSTRERCRARSSCSASCRC